MKVLINLGYKSAILLDDQQNVHIAYLKKFQDQAQLQYISNISGSWQVENPLPGTFLGVYGDDFLFPRYAEASVDLILLQDGQPAILYFDANTYNFAFCGPLNHYAYINYALDMKAVKRNSDGSWDQFTFPNIPDKTNSTCLPNGDRFGEFCKLFSLQDGRTLALTNSFHNHELLLFESAPNDLSSWTTHVLDSLSRSVELRITDDKYSFEFVSASLVNENSLHLVYGTSNSYGKGFIGSRPILYFYTRVNLDSLQSSTYTPFHYLFTPLRTFRTYSTILAQDNDTLHTTFFDQSNRATVLATTHNGGVNWAYDTVHRFNVNTYLKSVISNDSIRILAYEAEKDRLVLSSRALAGGPWRNERATTFEERGQAMSSVIRRISGQDEIYIVFNELGEEQLYFGSRKSASWSFEKIGEPGGQVDDIDLALDSQANACIAFTHKTLKTLNFGHKNGNVWETSVVASNTIPQNINIILNGTQIHLAYFDLEVGFLKHAEASSPSGPWNVEVVDSSSSIIGKHASFEIDAGGTLHISYMDVINSKVKYAHKAAGGGWMIEDVTESLNYTPNIVDLKVSSLGLPFIAFSDGSLNQLFFAEKGADDLWVLSQVEAESINLVGNPLRLIVDDKDHPWILYNYIELQDEMRLVRRDQQKNWHQVSVLNNNAQIANEFDFHLVGQDFFIIGKKNQLDNHGIGMLYAENGVKTSVPDLATQIQLGLVPNPTSGTLNISFTNPKTQNIRNRTIQPERSISTPCNGVKTDACRAT